jgi:hypothetical protein
MAYTVSTEPEEGNICYSKRKRILSTRWGRRFPGTPGHERAGLGSELVLEVRGLLARLGAERARLPGQLLCARRQPCPALS